MTDGSQSSSQAISMESVFVMMFKGALDKFQETWMGENGFNESKYNMQLMYLIHLNPDEEAQKRIWKAYNEKHEETSAMNLTQDQKTAAAGMVAVTEVVRFVCNTFDLIHSDIIGPARNKDAVAIDDMPPELLTASEPEATDESVGSEYDGE